MYSDDRLRNGEHSGIMILMGLRSQILAMLCQCLEKPNSSLPYANCPAGQSCGLESRDGLEE